MEFEDLRGWKIYSERQVISNTMPLPICSLEENDRPQIPT